MQALSDFLPVLAFVAAYFLGGIYVATAVLVAATVLQVAVTWWRTRTVHRVTLVSAAIVLVLGLATLLLHNQLLIQWKPTVLYLALGVALIASRYFGEKTLVERLLGGKLRTDARTWRLLNLSWALFFLVLAAVNLVFVYRFSLDTWVKWKGATIVLVLLFAVAQAFWAGSRVEAVDDGPGT